MLMALALLALLAAFLMPDYLREMEEAKLANAADQFRSVIYLTRTHAMLDGKRYRIRFVDIDLYDGEFELDEITSRQPVIERESDDPETYGEFLRVTEPWAQGVTLHPGIRCDGVRIGRPVFRDELEAALEGDFEEEEEEELFESEDSLYPELVFEPDGTCDWATIVLTDAPEDISYEDVFSDAELDAEFLEVIVDGRTGQAWIQRFLTEDEEELLREYGLPPVLRRDFLSPTELTEDNVREISEGRTRQ
jgi:hypothetical protein